MHAALQLPLPVPGGLQPQELRTPHRKCCWSPPSVPTEVAAASPGQATWLVHSFIGKFFLVPLSSTHCPQNLLCQTPCYAPSACTVSFSLSKMLVTKANDDHCPRDVSLLNLGVHCQHTGPSRPKVTVLSKEPVFISGDAHPGESRPAEVWLEVLSEPNGR